ncbi:RNB [Musa troglodytarum]|uniref:RNB n=2 Tax=Musa troglodytarum TaxID=320322 RepID=A0A9E7FVE1_9LILI|nr:RNB [Musa troglodytarum]
MLDPIVYGIKLKGLNDALTVEESTDSTKDTDSEQEEAVRALKTIGATMSCNPSKRPAVKVLSIIRSSPRRDAVIGLLALNSWLTEGETNGRELDYIQLIPTDSKLSTMVITVESLPGCAKERLINGDVSIERELVAARIEEWKEGSDCPKAQVIRMLGRAEEIEPQISAVLFEHAISAANFSSDSLSCLPNAPWKIPAEEYETRKDLRNTCTFTIDPASAADLDDALPFEKVSEKVFRIGVHIADVSRFVLPDTALDREARIRSTSVYIPQHKLLMLPPELSEQACSLVPGEDRLAFSISWDTDDTGNITGRWIGRSVIRSCCKLSYDDAQDIIDGGFEVDVSGKTGPKLHGQFELKDVVDSLRSLHGITKKMREIRLRNGAFWIEIPKIVFLFDESGNPCDSLLGVRKESSFLVEELMLLANRSVAEVISKAFPGCALLRRHAEPKSMKLKEFEEFCRKRGLELDASSSGKLHLALPKMREKLKTDPVLLQILLARAARAMQLAVYFCTGDLRGREDEWAHYGLSIPLYTHFTSPLRRYPDIVVHRTLAAVVEAEEAYAEKRQSCAASDGIGNRCFTGLYFDEEAAESEEGREALVCAAVRYGVPASEVVSEVAAYCNERKRAGKHVEQSAENVYLCALLKNKEVMFSDARVLRVGSTFMTVYINKFAIERRIYFGEVEGLTVEWIRTTGTLVLDTLKTKPLREVIFLRSAV